METRTGPMVGTQRALVIKQVLDGEPYVVDQFQADLYKGFKHQEVGGGVFNMGLLRRGMGVLRNLGGK